MNSYTASLLIKQAMVQSEIDSKPLWPDLHLKAFFTAAVAEFCRLKDGLFHMRQAPEDIQSDFHRDAGTCAVESSLVLLEDLCVPETALVVAGAEAGEKLANSKPGDIRFVDIVRDGAVSIASSHAAAFQSAVNIIHDLERAGDNWQHNPAVMRP